MSKDCSLLSNKQAGYIDEREILLSLFILNFKKLCSIIVYDTYKGR